MLCLALLLSACSVTYVDANGAQRVIGLVNMTISKQELGTGDATHIELQNLGLAIQKTTEQASFSVGYNSSRAAYISADSSVIICVDEQRSLIPCMEESLDAP
jgi:hypothetical protein